MKKKYKIPTSVREIPNIFLNYHMKNSSIVPQLIQSYSTLIILYVFKCMKTVLTPLMWEITNIYFLALTNTLFKSKNTTYLRDLFSWKKRFLFKMCEIFFFDIFLGLWNLFFQIQQHQLYIKQLLNRFWC
jgi:hypothetical protein